MRLWLIILLLFIYNNKCCFDDEDCDDLKWCNGYETCINETCQDGESPCQLVIENTIKINKVLGKDYYQVLCYEKDHLCLSRYRCFSDKDCNDNLSCNGEEICDQGTNLCIKSNKILCKSDEICDFKQNKCIKNFSKESSSSSENTIDIVLTILISVFIVILITLLLILVLSYYIIKPYGNK
jgi:hypothetical protein